jgi:hypothetical protein
MSDLRHGLLIVEAAGVHEHATLGGCACHVPKRPKTNGHGNWRAEVRKPCLGGLGSIGVLSLGLSRRYDERRRDQGLVN